ncbi:NAD(P)-dependent oxidoreductase [Streptomyces antimicrobicus]|uniref:NAD(P)-binding domain-containing protein n=1 Tax=Streptomyces antimicrobicus TaxID=2883108 RepID=A0ABS8B8R6_9ACTN|nr:NAD(P)-binding domain-containing protein [Streptomyces antimicrobicus]MCB5180939.1 NAD(P)-binding domain-containing protein [Streptomyces antimicrobicus]
MTQTANTSTNDRTARTPVALLGLGAMGTALARAWLAAGHPLTVWNRTPARAEALAAEGAVVAATAADAVAAAELVVVCLLDDASVGTALADADLTGKDLVDLVTGTPSEARERARWAEGRGARFLDGGIMAVPPMIGVPDSGGYVFYSGSRALFDRHRAALEVPAGARFAGTDPGAAALHDGALLCAMYGLFAGMTHAFALVEGEDVDRAAFTSVLTEWLGAMTAVHAAGAAAGPASPLAMQVAATATLLRTTEEQGVDPGLVQPYFRLMERQLARGGDEAAGLVSLLRDRA